MADDAEDLVSKVKIEGLEETTKALEDFGDKGSEAFDKVGEAAAGAGVVVPKAADKITSSTKKAGESVDGLNKNLKSVDGKPTAQELDKISSSTEKLVTNIRKVGKDLAQFATRIAALGTAGTLAIVGIAKLGANLAAQVNVTTSAFDKNNAAQQRAVASNLSAEQAAIQFASQQSVLNRQVATGVITYDQYFDTMKSNRLAYKEQIKVTEQLQEAQERAREETEALAKTAADRKAFTDLQETFGGPLLGSLVSLGTAAVAAKHHFIEAFGPGLSAFVDTLTQALAVNGRTINHFFEEAGAKISQFVSSNGPAIQQALASIGAAVGAIFDGVISALPTLLAFFNNQLVPAAKVVAGAVDSIVQGFNNLFGTQFTTGAAVIIVAVTSMTGGFKLMFGLLSLITPLLTVLPAVFTLLISPVGLLAAAFVALYFAIDWKAFANNALTAGQSIVAFFANIPQTIGKFFTDLFAAVAAGWSALGQAIIDSWNFVVEFFASLPDKIGAIFTSIGETIKSAFIAAFDAVSNYVQSWVTKLVAFFKPVIDAIKFIGSSGGDTGGDTAPAFASGGRVRGPGTSTSDSIIARLSNNEWVMQARAVRKYGSAFMRAINEGRFDPSKLMGFASGGLVSAMGQRPLALPSIGPASTRGHSAAMALSLTIGGEQFDNLLVPDEDTASRLTRYAVNRQARSAGRKPAWSGKGR